MDCRTFHKHLEDYLQGGLDFPGRFGIERHGQQCLACGKDLADAQRLSRMAREIERVPAPPDFEAELLRRIQASGLRRRPALWRLQYLWPDWLSGRSLAWGASAAGLLVAALLISLQWLGQEQIRTDPAAIADGVSPQIRSLSVPNGLPARPSMSPPLAADRSTDPIVLLPDGGADPRFVIESDFSSGPGEPAGAEYVEFAVPGADGRRVVMRLPTTIRLRHVQPSEEYFLRNVSH
jgi:hypothetical protein